jgi:hypothetical protein
LSGECSLLAIVAKRDAASMSVVFASAISAFARTFRYALERLLAVDSRSDDARGQSG